MLSRFSICTSTLSPHLLHQEFTHPCVTGPHLLQHVLFWHRLSQQQASTSDIFIFPSRSERESRQSRLRDVALKHFVRSLTDGKKTRPSDGVELQVSSPWKSDDKESDGEVKLSQTGSEDKLEVGLGHVQAKLRVQSDNVKEEVSVYSKRVGRGSWIQHKSRSSLSPGITDHPTKPANYTGKNEESATETSKEVKVISAGSRKFVEVYTVVIRRVLTRKFLGQLQEKINFLHSAAVPVSHVQMLLKKRAFISVSPEKLVAMVELLTEIFESRSIALRVLTVNTGILEQPLDMSKHKMHLLSQFGIDKRACIKLATTIGMWTLRTEKYGERLNFLKEIGMDAQARSNVLYRSPLIISYSKSSLKAAVDFLLQDWGFTMNEVIRILMQFPQQSATHIVSQFNLLRDLGFSHDNISSMIRRQPSLLASSNKAVKDKFDFLRQVNRDISEVYKFPRFLACSLEGRIVPRFKALEAVSLRKKPALSSILACNTSIFRRRYNIPESVECI